MSISKELFYKESPLFANRGIIIECLYIPVNKGAPAKQLGLDVFQL